MRSITSRLFLIALGFGIGLTAIASIAGRLAASGVPQSSANPQQVHQAYEIYLWVRYLVFGACLSLLWWKIWGQMVKLPFKFSLIFLVAPAMIYGFANSMPMWLNSVLHCAIAMLAMYQYLALKFRGPG